MSARNGDKSRFGRQRKQKIARRVVLRALRTPDPAPAGTVAGSEPVGALASAARLVGSALGTIAVETHLAGTPAAE